MHSMLAEWAPPLERSKMATFVFTGNYSSWFISYHYWSFFPRTIQDSRYTSISINSGKYYWFFFVDITKDFNDSCLLTTLTKLLLYCSNTTTNACLDLFKIISIWEFLTSGLIMWLNAGAQFGTVITLPLSGILCEYGFDGGWPTVFYVFGGLGVVWFCFWMPFVADSPATHPTISAAEKHYICSSLRDSIKKVIFNHIAIF